MSYLIDLVGPECPTCRRDFNPARQEYRPWYRLWRVLDFAIFGEVRDALRITAWQSDIRSMNGQLASDTLTTLETALARLRNPSNLLAIRALNAGDNGMAHEQAMTLLLAMIVDAKTFPQHRWRIV